MPPRKLSPDAGRPGEFSIPAERGNRGFKVKANQDKYDVWAKDISTNLPTTYIDTDDNNQTKTIRLWIANYGLKAKGAKDDEPFIDNVDDYTLEFDEVEGAKYVYFDGKVAQVFKNAKHQNGKVTVTLGLGDPNVGYGP